MTAGPCGPWTRVETPELVRLAAGSVGAAAGQGRAATAEDRIKRVFNSASLQYHTTS